jgi:hypothetical protein
MKFTNKLYLPVIKNNVRYTSINNDHYFQIIKFILNNDDEGLNEYFEWILNEIIVEKSIIPYISNIEKFLILLDNRSITIGNILSIKSEKNAKVDIHISSIKNKIVDNISNIELTKICSFDNFKVYLSIPKSMIIDNIDTVYMEVIDKLQIENEVILFSSLTNQEKNNIINNIPASLTNDILSFVKTSQENLTKISLINKNTNIGIEEVNINSYDSTLFLFLKSIFKDDLMNFYELQYNMITKMNVSNDHFMSMTPNECKLFVKFYNEEKKKEEEAQSKQQSSMPSLPSIPSFK